MGFKWLKRLVSTAKAKLAPTVTSEPSINGERRKPSMGQMLEVLNWNLGDFISNAIIGGEITQHTVIFELETPKSAKRSGVTLNKPRISVKIINGHQNNSRIYYIPLRTLNDSEQRQVRNRLQQTKAYRVLNGTNVIFVFKDKLRLPTKFYKIGHGSKLPSPKEVAEVHLHGVRFIHPHSILSFQRHLLQKTAPREYYETLNVPKVLEIELRWEIVDGIVKGDLQYILRKVRSNDLNAAGFPADSEGYNALGDGLGIITIPFVKPGAGDWDLPILERISGLKTVKKSTWHGMISYLHQKPVVDIFEQILTTQGQSELANEGEVRGELLSQSDRPVIGEVWNGEYSSITLIGNTLFFQCKTNGVSWILCDSWEYAFAARIFPQEHKEQALLFCSDLRRQRSSFNHVSWPISHHGNWVIKIRDTVAEKILSREA